MRLTFLSNFGVHTYTAAAANLYSDVVTNTCTIQSDVAQDILTSNLQSMPQQFSQAKNTNQSTLQVYTQLTPSKAHDHWTTTLQNLKTTKKAGLLRLALELGLVPHISTWKSKRVDLVREGIHSELERLLAGTTTESIQQA